MSIIAPFVSWAMNERIFIKSKPAFHLAKVAFDKLAAVQAALDDCMRLRVAGWRRS